MMFVLKEDAEQVSMCFERRQAGRVFESRVFVIMRIRTNKQKPNKNNSPKQVQMIFLLYKNNNQTLFQKKQETNLLGCLFKLLMSLFDFGLYFISFDFLAYFDTYGLI